MSDRKIGLILAGVTAFCWGSLAFFVKAALEFTDAGTIVSMRMLVAFLLLFIYFIIFNPGEIKKLVQNPPWLGVLASIFLSLNYFSYTKGVEFTSASNAQVMIQLAPMLFIVIGILYFKESIHFRKIIGLLLSLIGFGFFFKDQLTQAVNADFLRGDLWILLSAFTWASYASFQKVLTQKWHPQTLNLLVYFVCAVILTSGAEFKAFETWSLTSWSVLLFLGVNTFIAYGCFTASLSKAPASEVSLIIISNPIITLVIVQLGNIFEIAWIPKEQLGLFGFLGASMVVVGIGIALYKKKDQTLSTQGHSLNPATPENTTFSNPQHQAEFTNKL